ncbi:nucleolar GTP-ase, partial [Pseudoloma neurophilia]
FFETLCQMVKENFYRNKSKCNLQNMYNNKPKHNAYGEVVIPAAFQSKKSKVAVIPPNFKLFTSSRTINMDEIAQEKEKSTYEVLLKKGQIPFSILSEKKGKRKMKYDDIHKSKRAKAENLLLSKKNTEQVNSEKIPEPEKSKIATNISKNNDAKINGEYDILKPGKSKRIWGELYKVLDTSDVIIHVLDARYPKLFLSKQIIDYIKEHEYKNLILVLNKVDLIPAHITQKNIEILSKYFPTIAMHSKSLSNFYGKLDLFNLLRQYKKIHKKTISVGFVGYPNVGKSSIINILINKNSVKAAPLAGETQNWQHVKLDKGINLFDCPGIIDEKNKSLS